jgi:hypothetical protein
MVSISRTRLTKVVLGPVRMRTAWPRSQLRTLLISLVRAPTRASRMPQIVFHSRERALGMCTEGRSMRQETSLSTRASRTSVFVRRAPTPRLRTSVADTTRTSCPSVKAASAIPNASAQVSITTRLGGRLASSPGRRTVSQRFSSRIAPVLLRMHTWDFLPPRSSAQCSMAGSFHLRLERVKNRERR